MQCYTSQNSDSLDHSGWRCLLLRPSRSFWQMKLSNLLTKFRAECETFSICHFTVFTDIAESSPIPLLSNTFNDSPSLKTLSKTTIHRVLRDLEKHGLITRETTATDGRLFYISLSDKGNNLWQSYLDNVQTHAA